MTDGDGYDAERNGVATYLLACALARAGDPRVLAWFRGYARDDGGAADEAAPAPAADA